MKYRTILSILVALTLSFAVHATVQDEIGYTELKQEFGAALPDGSNLSVLQVEGFDSSGNWRPSASGGLAYLKMIYPIDPSPSSGCATHATAVTNYLANSSTSLLPKLQELQVASYSRYQSLSLRTGNFVSPNPANWDLETHSYSCETIYSQNALQLLDYRINRDRVTVCVSLNNGTAAVPAMWGNNYNAITVGTATGKHSRGGTTLEGVGRTKPDLVGTATYTSYTTPIVASAAGILIGEAKRTISLAAAKDPRTIKALLMAGATKEEFATWSQTAAQPLDAIYGAGQVNINNSYRMLIAGKQSPGASLCLLKGWDLGQSGNSAVYYFDVPVGQTLKFSTVLTWHRELCQPGDFWSFTSSLADLNLRLHNSNSSFALGTVVAESTSALDNVEHIYRPTLPAGRYALEVSGPAGTTFGIAWNGILSGSVTTTPTVVVPAITAQPLAVSVTAGQSAKFSIIATGGGLTYQWSKDNTVISGATAASYTISATTAASAGSYSVAVSNTAGNITSAAATLTVAAAPAAPLSATSDLKPVAFTARGDNGTKEGVAMLFDGLTSTKWLDFSATTWVQASFATPVAVSTYSLTSANDYPERDPASWTLSGSNDGASWTVIESRSAQSWSARKLTRDFVLTQPSAAYLLYRIDMTAKSGAITQLSELKFKTTTAAAAAPVTTTELTPSSISARGENGTKEGIANLFDHSTATKWLDFSGTTWVQVAFAVPHALDAYSITSANDYPERDPASWTLSGSNDGTTWTVIEKQSAQSWSARKLTRDFVLTQTSAAYLQYRIEMTAKSGVITQLSELEFSGR